MTDPLSIAGSVAGVTSLGIQVVQSLLDFYKLYKGQDSEISSITGRLENLVITFERLGKALSTRNFQSDEQNLISSIEKSIEDCNEHILELQEECQKFVKTSTTGIKAALKVTGRRVTYPFRQSTLQKLDEDISEIRSNLSLALDILQLNDNERSRNTVTEMKSLITLIRHDQISTEIHNWLKAPDALIDHNAACAKRNPGSGMWLTKGSKFQAWSKDDNSILWLRGFAGSGKSVLCSTAIQSVLQHRGSNSDIGIAFFYFTFSNDSKQDESSMARALLLQLSSQLQDGHEGLRQLKASHEASIPPSIALHDLLEQLIRRFRHVYIFLDALDESPRNGAREGVLDALEILRGWGVRHLHLFVTSRDEPDIRESLTIPVTQQVHMHNADIDKDIADFISQRLREDRRLRKLLLYHDKILEILARGAKGVFRWVECQLRSLQSCPRSQNHLERVLNSLPQSLDETYERMLCNIDHHLIEDVRRILTLLCFSSRPLTVRELIDGIAVQIDGSVGLNRKRRLHDSDDIRDICFGIVDVGLGYHAKRGPDHQQNSDYEENLTPTVQIAHFSVQEYLESERIRSQRAAIFSLDHDTAHAEIAQICLVYLLEESLTTPRLNQSLLDEHPLALFAAMYWHHHYRTSANCVPELDPLIMRLFSHQHAFMTWVKLYEKIGYGTSIDFDRQSEDIASPIYYMALLDLPSALLETIGKERTKRRIAIANTKCGDYDTLLAAAIFGGHEQVVQILLDNGAEINAVWKGNSALQFAASMGDEKMVQLLLDHGDHIEAGDDYYDNALRKASLDGDELVVRMLLDHGIDAKAQIGKHGNAPQVASARGRLSSAQRLPHCGASITSRDTQGRLPIHLACAKGKTKTFDLLLHSGADLRAIDLQGRTCLHHAASAGSVDVVNRLLKEGLKPNIADRDGWTPLHWAAKKGSSHAIESLLKAGSITTVESLRGWTPYSVAVFHHKASPPRIASVLEARKGDSSEVASQLTADPLPILTRATTDEECSSPGVWQEGSVCDGCYRDIYGPRYRCLDCPDFDFCFKCKNTSGETHSGHRFLEIEERINEFDD